MILSGLQKIKSYFRSSTGNESQVASISGNNNTIHQTIINTDSVGGRFDNHVLDINETKNLGYPVLEAAKGDPNKSVEYRRIADYRKIADDGNAETAISLLEKLSEEAPFKEGYWAFRLNFNLGIIWQNIGEAKQAAGSLKTAYRHFPENPKAKAGLALANLLEDDPQEAFNQAQPLIELEGEHRDLALIILIHAARALRAEFDILEYVEADDVVGDVEAAWLDYLAVLNRSKYASEIENAYQRNQSDDNIASHWALHVLDDAKRNQAFLLGQLMEDNFEDRLQEAASILRSTLERALQESPPNRLLLPSQANNAAVALRLIGDIETASKLLDRTIETQPSLSAELAQIRAVLLLQEDKDIDALDLIDNLSGFPELQVMASEIEAKLGRSDHALQRIEKVLTGPLEFGLKTQAIATKGRIAINSKNQEKADQAFDELIAHDESFVGIEPIRLAYRRVFDPEVLRETDESDVAPENTFPAPIDLSNSDQWDFATTLQVANELTAVGRIRDAAELLKGMVSLTRESPALSALCDACLQAGMGALAKEISEGLSNKLKSSIYGLKFLANVGILNGEIRSIVPLTRKIFERNPNSLDALEWYVQALIRTDQKPRAQKLISALNDKEMIGDVSQRSQYAKILVFCDETERARDYAYQLYCEHRSNHRAWMAISASVLAIGTSREHASDLLGTEIAEDYSFEIEKPNGDTQKYIIENDSRIFDLREENLCSNHPIAQAVLGKSVGDEFHWPNSKTNKVARVTSVKHKILDTFHFVLAQYEERFPGGNAFKSISVDPSTDQGLDEIKAILQERAEYSQDKAKEYAEGRYPMAILGHHLGLDAIDTFLGLYRECGTSPKVSSCRSDDQALAKNALSRAKETGVLLDTLACYLIRRLGIEDKVATAFGQIGITQVTLDIFADRLMAAKQTSLSDSGDGFKRTGSLSYRDGRMVLTERTEQEVADQIALLESDLNWLKSDCSIVPAVAENDPDNAVIQLRSQAGGQFLDDILAADGSKRVLISEDFHLRQWGAELFSVEGAWIQELLFHLQTLGLITSGEVIKGTISLLDAGEQHLSISPERLWAAAGMKKGDEISQTEFELICSLIGQEGADLESHAQVAIWAIHGLWNNPQLLPVKHVATSTILRNLTRIKGVRYQKLLKYIANFFEDPALKAYVLSWQKGHFLT